MIGGTEPDTEPKPEEDEKEDGIPSSGLKRAGIETAKFLAEGVGFPIDAVNLGLRKLGVSVPEENPYGGIAMSKAIEDKFGDPDDNKDDISFEALAIEDVSQNEMMKDIVEEDDEYIDILREYGESRYGEDGMQKEGEADEEYLKRFLSHTRQFENNSILLGTQIDWLRDASAEERIKFGYLYKQMDRIPSFRHAGGTGYLSAIKDFGSSFFTDPINAIGLGAGGAAGFIGRRAIIHKLRNGMKKEALEELAKYSGKELLKNQAGRIAAVGVIAEGAMVGVTDLDLQEVEGLSKKFGNDTPTEKNYARAALVGTLGAGVGVLGLRLGGLNQKSIMTNAENYVNKQEQISKKLKIREDGIVDAENVARAVDDSKAAIEGTNAAFFDLEGGRNTLDSLGKIDDDAQQLGQVEFNLELMKRVGRVVTSTVQELANTGRLGNLIDEDTTASKLIAKVVMERLEKTSTKVKSNTGLLKTSKSVIDIEEDTAELLKGIDGKGGGILDNLDLADEGFDDVLQNAISRAGLEPEQFLNAMGTSFSNAGSFLNTASQVGKIMKRLGRLDPTVEAILKKHSAASDVADEVGWGAAIMRRLDIERRALMTSAIATTIRNVTTAGIVLPMHIAADGIESSLRNIGRGTTAAMKGDFVGARGHYADIFDDAFGKLVRLKDITNTTILADTLLQHQPRMAQQMDRTLQEVDGDATLSAFTRTVSTLNVAQDQFFRRGVFVASIDKKLKRAGVIVRNPTKLGQYANLEEFIESGKALPASVLSDSVGDALEFTFTKTPPGNSLAGMFVKITEKIGPLPVPLPNTLMFPFARFMANAMKFMYDFSPAGAIKPTANGVRHIARTATEKYYAKLGKVTKQMAKKGNTKEAEEKLLVQYQQAREQISKAVVGTAALTAAVHYRSNNQDTKFYEHRSDNGEAHDLRPYFPLAPYLAIADVIVKHQNDDLGSVNIKEVLATIVGYQARTGTSSFILDNFDDTFAGMGELSDDTPTSERVGELLGGFVGEISGGYLTPFRMLRDIQASYDTEASTVKDTKQTSGIGINERFQSAMTNVWKNNLPQLNKELDPKQSATDSRDINRRSSIAGVLGMPRKTRALNPAEAEMERLGISTYTVGRKSSDKTSDALVDEEMGKLVEKHIAALLDDARYTTLTDARKRATMDRALSYLRERATNEAKYQVGVRATAEGRGAVNTPFDRAKYNDLNDVETRIADEEYMNIYGKSVLEMVREEPEINHYQKATELGKYLSAETGVSRKDRLP